MLFTHTYTIKFMIGKFANITDIDICRHPISISTPYFQNLSRFWVKFGQEWTYFFGGENWNESPNWKNRESWTWVKGGFHELSQNRMVWIDNVTDSSYLTGWISDIIDSDHVILWHLMVSLLKIFQTKKVSNISGCFR